MTLEMSVPWLTVVMPVHHGEKWIDATLASLAAEADAGIEVLVIDSSVTDGTRAIALQYADRLSMRVIQRTDLPMWPAKTNFGVEIARAAHVSWLHQDDLWFPGRASAARDWITQAPDAVLHLSAAAIVDSVGGVQGIWRCPFAGDCTVDAETLLERLLVQNFIAAPAPVYRKDAWLACGGLDAPLWYTGDWDIWLKLAGQGETRHHSGVTTGFRVHGSSLTVTGSRDAQDFASQMQIVLDRHLPRLHGQGGAIRRAAEASIAVNSALATAAIGKPLGIMLALMKVLALGPVGIHRYLRDSRIMERVAPRLRLKLAGKF
jgi:glycosyltransferase involved in cell wall biosynthesis